jgi:hypothetical protein
VVLILPVPLTVYLIPYSLTIGLIKT